MNIHQLEDLHELLVMFVEATPPSAAHTWARRLAVAIHNVLQDASEGAR